MEDFEFAFEQDELEFSLDWLDILYDDTIEEVYFSDYEDALFG